MIMNNRSSYDVLLLHFVKWVLNICIILQENKNLKDLPVASLRCTICNLDKLTPDTLASHINGQKHKLVSHLLFELEKCKLNKLREQVKIQEEPGRQLCKMCSINVKNLAQHKETNLHKKVEDIFMKECCDESFIIYEYQQHLTSSKHLFKTFGKGKILL